LAERARRGFNATGQAIFGVAWADGTELAERPKVIKGDRVLTAWVCGSLFADSTHAAQVQK
jgi:hypothetical protein